MGTWDAGVFGRDSACDTRDALVEELSGRIQKIFADGSSSDLDDEGEGAIVPLVSIVGTLCLHTEALPPPSSVVRIWRERYLAIFDEQISELATEGFARVRREVVDREFRALTDIAEKSEAARSR